MYYTSARLSERNKKWRGFLSYKDAEGNYRQLSRTLVARTKTEAKNELEAWRWEMEQAHELELARGSEAISDKNALVPDYVDAFIDSLEKRGTIESSSVKGYKSSAKYIREGFPKTSVGGLKPEHVERWEEWLIKRGLSPSTVGKAHRLLKQVMKSACNRQVIDFNPVGPVKPPKRRNKKTGINALDVDGRTELLNRLNAMELTPVVVAAQIALYTGLRRSEICALRWQDVDYDNGCIWVRQSLGEGEGGFYLKLSKTDKVRDVALPISIVALLEDWSSKMGLKRSRSELLIEGNIYVLTCSPTYFSPHALSYEWGSLAKMLGIRGTEGRIPTFHDLRHTWATMYLAAGGDVKTAASNLGHSNVAMTLNVYASADPIAKKEAARITEEAMTR